MTQPSSNNLPGERNDCPMAHKPADEPQYSPLPYFVVPQPVVPRPFYRPMVGDRETENRRLAEYLEEQLRALGDEINDLPMTAIAFRCRVADRLLRGGLALLEKAGRLRVWHRRHWADRNQYEWLVPAEAKKTEIAPPADEN